jgi:CBS domain-containing protein
MKIDEVMTEDVLTVTTGKTLKKTARLLADTGISGIPVVDDDGKLVGVISGRHPLRAQLGGAAGRLRGSSSRPARERGEARARTVGEAMTAPPSRSAPTGRSVGGRLNARRGHQPAPVVTTMAS